MRKQRRGVWKIVAANVLAVILLVSMFSPMCFADTGNKETKAAALQQNIANELQSLDVEKNEDDPVAHESKAETAANGLSEEKVDQAKSDLFDGFADRALEDLRDWAETNSDCAGVLETVEKTDKADDAYMESDDAYVESEDFLSVEQEEKTELPAIKSGDLEIVPSLNNVTKAALKNDVEMTVKFSADDEILSYSADVFSQNGNKLKSMLITNGKPFKIGVGDTIVIHGVEEGVHYTIDRELLEGFTRTSETEVSGNIVADETVKETFAETYAATGAAEFRIRYENKDQPLPRYQYEYMLCDAFTGVLQKTAFNMEDGDIYFGSILYQNLGEPTNPVLTIEPFGLSEDIDFNEPRHGFAVELIPTDDGRGHLSFEQKFYDLDEAMKTAEVKICDQCNGSGMLGEDICINCKGRGISQLNFTVEPLEEAYFGEKAKTPFELTLTAKVENVDKPEDVSWSPVLCLYYLSEDGLYYRDGGRPDENGIVSFGPLVFYEEDIGHTYYMAVAQMHEDGEGLLMDDTAFGYEITVTEGDNNNVVCDYKYIDASELFLKCEACDGQGWMQKDGQQIQIEYLTDFASYAGFEFAAPFKLNVESAEDAIAIVGDEYQEIEYIPIVKDANGDLILDPKYHFMWTNYFTPYSGNFEPVYLYIYTANNDQYVLKIEMPSEADLKNTDLFAEAEDGVFVPNKPYIMQAYQMCEKCEGEGTIVNENWEPNTDGVEPVFKNYFFTASMTDDADNIETDALPPVEIDGTENCAEVPEIEMIVVAPEGVEEVVESEAEAAQELTEEEIALIKSALSELEPEELVAAAVAAADASDVTAVAKQIVLSEFLPD